MVISPAGEFSEAQISPCLPPKRAFAKKLSAIKASVVLLT